MVHAVWHFSSINLLEGKKVSDDAFIQETMEKESIQESSESNPFGNKNKHSSEFKAHRPF